jgi:hypothetical protein
MIIPEFERTVLVESFPDAGYEAGDIGIVVYIHAGGAGYELEMMTADGHTRGVLTVEAHQVRPVNRQDMLHVRVVETGDTRQSA